MILALVPAVWISDPLCGFADEARLAGLGDPVDFGQQVRPVLSDKCFQCHGPDAQAREAGLRLDRLDEADDVLSPAAPQESELLRRIQSDDPGERMPPPGAKLPLSPAEIDLLQRWIEQGAPYEQHWSLLPVRRPALPPVVNVAWPRNAIDRFVLARLDREGMEPTPEASRVRLIRRLRFDLTGLPPNPAEVDAFLADNRPDAYERLVDRLLQDPAHGERMAADWLDVARYSDTYGYQVDRERFVWPWRDWVIRAVNGNLSYDRFLTWQLAGDLLPGASAEQILATTFCRLHPQKVEGGSVPEEFRMEYVADRTHTLGTAFLGLALECCRCHDHKYDPISQQEYYGLFALFNNIDEAGLYSYFTDAVPTPALLLADASDRKEIGQLRRRVDAAEAELRRVGPRRDGAFEDWLRDGRATLEPVGQIHAESFEDFQHAEIKTVPGVRGRGVRLTGDDGIELPVGNFRRFEPFSVSLWLQTPDRKERAVVFHRSRAWTDAGSRGYQLLIEEGCLSAALVHFWPGNAIAIRTRQEIPTGQWLHVVLTYDGSSRAGGLRLFLNGRRADVETVRDNLSKQITGGGGDQITIGQRFRDRGFTGGRVDEFRVYDRELGSLEIEQLYDGRSLQEAYRADGDVLTGNQRRNLQEYFLSTVDAEAARARRQLRACREQLCQRLDGIAEIMVMRELPQPRPTYLLQRGAYDAPGTRVPPGTPAVLPPFPDQPRNRLGLARWLTDPGHPLTARVAVNRFWQLCFGRGLVATPEDFGSQGAAPSHPQLLDWLAADFAAHGWDVKRLLKQLVTSATYRQDSAVRAELLRKDPRNELLGRGPRYRLPAEMLRDNALAASGLLVRRIGGPPVRPYELTASFKPLPADTGPGLYRRSLYTFWKRTAPAPVMMTLDAAKRDVCTVRRERTDSPLQALVLLNDPQLVEAARVLGQRLLLRHGPDARGLITGLFQKLVGRKPEPAEAELLADLYAGLREDFAGAPERARQLLDIGAAPVDPSLSAVELAAATALASTVMNHDECVTKR
jgi:hypothetical protein